MIAGTEPRVWSHTQEVAEATGGVAVLGVHPWFVSGVEDLDAALAELSRRAPAGIGEIGLDAARRGSAEAWQRQRRFARAQLALARELDLPVVFHCVRAAGELLRIVELDGLPAAGGMLHGWSGSPEMAMRAVRAGLHVSIGPMVCRPRARKARASAVAIPDDFLLVETDSPDQAPPGVDRGEPAHVVAVLTEIAELRNATVEQLAELTSANLARLWPRPTQ